MRPLTSLDDWSLDVIRQLLVSREGEPAWFDFKQYLYNRQDPQSSTRLCETACAMANTGGGFIIFGVADKGSTPEAQMVGIEITGEERRDFSKAIVKVRPSVRFDAKPLLLPLRAGRGIFIVHVMSDDVLRPHMNEHDWKFYQRGEGGTSVPMSYQQVRDVMVLSADRRNRIALFTVKVAQYAGIAADIQRYEEPNIRFCHDRFDVTMYDALLIDIWGALPADSLLSQLMEIARTARRMNNILDFAGTPTREAAGLSQSYSWQLKGNADELICCCNECEERLNELFGLLPPSTPE